MATTDVPLSRSSYFPHHFLHYWVVWYRHSQAQTCLECHTSRPTTLAPCPLEPTDVCFFLLHRSLSEWPSLYLIFLNSGSHFLDRWICCHDQTNGQIFGTLSVENGEEADPPTTRPFDPSSLHFPAIQQFTRSPDDMIMKGHNVHIRW